MVFVFKGLLYSVPFLTAVMAAIVLTRALLFVVWALRCTPRAADMAVSSGAGVTAIGADFVGSCVLGGYVTIFLTSKALLDLIGLIVFNNCGCFI